MVTVGSVGASLTDVGSIASLAIQASVGNVANIVSVPGVAMVVSTAGVAKREKCHVKTVLFCSL